MTKVKELTLSYGDVGITAAAFDVFWRQYAAAQGGAFYYSEVSAKRVRDYPALIEYQILCAWYEGNARMEEPWQCALIRFQSLPSNRQRLTFYFYQRWHDDLLRLEPALSEQEARNIFDSFLAYLRDEGYLDEQPQSPTPGMTSAGTRHGGRPGLVHGEVIYRLAKAQEGEEIKHEDPGMTWKEIAREIRWDKGTNERGLASLRDARRRLRRLEAGDPLLEEVAEYRAKETKET